MTHIVSIAYEDRTVYLRALYCTATYAGHLEGAHTTLTNSRKIEALRRKAEGLFPNQPVFVHEPVRTLGPAIYGYADGAGGPVYRELLPKLTNIAAFDSTEVAGQDGCASSLTIVWFDDAPLCPPLDGGLVDVLSRIDWDAHARSHWP